MYKENLSKIREYMNTNNIEAYILTKFDPHNSEYGSDKFNPISFLTGFTGSTVTCVIFKNEVGIWVDGRYYIQADEQTNGTGIIVHKLAQPNVLPYLEYVIKTVDKNGKICFDGTTLPYGDIKKLIDSNKNYEFLADCEFIYSIWANRPESLNNKIYDFDIKYAGKTLEEKIASVRELMAKDNADYFVISQLEDIAWFTNLRGQDVNESPTFASYCVVGKNDVALFLEKSKIDFELEKMNKLVKVYDYNEIFNFIDSNINVKADNRVAINPKVANYKLYTSIKAEVVDIDYDYTTVLKAVKNEVELQGLRNANIRDNVAMVRLVKWLKENQQAGLTEVEIEEKVLACREDGDLYKMPSFAPIVAFGANGAKMHYKAQVDSCATVKGDNLLLIDSGANYLDGTTDITRTFAIGKVTEEMKKDFTLTLKSVIGLSTAKFLKGTVGKQLDMFARNIMWKNGQDYKSGTGHGIGHFLSVHEGPQSVSPKAEYVFEEGMLVTNEPGVYKANKYGIRLENTIVSKFVETNEDGTFLGFETISFFPMDLECINKDLMEQWEIDWLNDYHKETYDKLSKFLNEEEKAWLKNETRSI